MKMRGKPKPVARPSESLADLRLGDWRDVFADVKQVDAVICDPPYGARTHSFAVQRADGCAPDGLRPDYTAWTADNVSEFVHEWSESCRGWIVALTSHDLIPAWEAAFAEVDRYVFVPIPCVIRGMSCRLVGDGPSSWTVYAMVARPRTKEFMAWGTLPGAYTGIPSDEAGGGRGKPMWLMNALVRDYSRPGDLVCDPFVGWGTTLAAAVGLGRRALGAEVDPEAFAEAQRRLARPLQTDLFGGVTA